ncbi:MAG TPA: hypothetical protein VMZ27_16600 [Candidatus Saccharimonadales bacterium]|nr:hypothetical protein [Candidatus Saccharimonadales bacterium]
MMCLIQNCKSLQFLRNDGVSWTPNESEAKAFQSSLSALEFYQRHAVPDAQVVLRFEASKALDLTLPLSASCR